MKRPTAATKEAVVEDYRAGLPVNTIAARHGVSLESVRSWARAAGLTKREGKPGRCRACHQQVLLYDGHCGSCRADIPLTGGRWVPKRGIVVWVLGA